MDDFVVEICMDAEPTEKKYYCEVRERETDDLLFRGPHADTRQMAKHGAVTRLATMHEHIVSA